MAGDSSTAPGRRTAGGRVGFSAQVRGTAENTFKYFDHKNGTFLLNIFGNTIASPCISQVGDAEKLFLPFPELL